MKRWKASAYLQQSTASLNSNFLQLGRRSGGLTGLGRLMDSGGGSGGAALSGGEFQTARRGFVLIFVFI